MATGTREVVDYSFSRIDLDVAKAAGIVGCMRYLYRNGKGLTPAEVALFRRAAMALGLNYEAGAGDFIGRAAGVEHAQSADRLARELGLGGNVIVFSADFDVQPWQYQAVGDAVAGALWVLGDGKVGCYGHARLMAYLWGRFGNRIFYWQTYAWSGGYVSPYADLYQFLNGQDFAGGQVDFNDVRGRTFWAIGTNAHTTAGGSAAPIIEEPDMDATDKKIAADTLAATQAAARDAHIARGNAVEAKRLAQVMARQRPPRTDVERSLRPPLAAGVPEPSWPSTLTPGQKWPVDQPLFSSDGRFYLVAQGDGNVVVYDVDGTPVWNSGTSSRPAPTGSYLVLQTDGNLVFYTAGGKVVWAKGSKGSPRAATMQRDGNLVVNFADGSNLGVSGTHR